MAKQLNVDLNFRANTTQAQQQIQQLQTSLTQIAAAGTVGIGGEKITAEMKQASAAAKELQMHLSKAMNAQTGTLDLNRLNNSLTGAKTNLQALSSSLLQIGPTGTTAFTQLATAVSQADRPMLALNGKLTQLWTVMKNTAKWQLSSSMIHGFIGGVSQAYRYAQDLNESLNNIRIVTGYSADYMENFAIQANKAAKALSTTTNEYAKASLIYFQQGLNESQVKERTDITIKMANVSRQSAEIVSDQMTAVWNNFDNGSKSLEYYADVMTALGAKTASSTDEIAGGLEKFAAVADTIGLSYEYAASALATITANTRQSEEVVGTALKTIFARIQGLKLGETLEDGVDLNKYSEALEKVGVEVLDANNNLIRADEILKNTAERWKTLSDAQQTALAQTVAGVRQYNQFVALMDNWDDGTSDSMIANLKTSMSSTGALQEQADTYAESWEAARDRVTASAEAIYDALLNDKFFINLNNMFSDLLDSINGFIDEIGGLKTIMVGTFGLLASYLGNKIQPMINNLRANFQVLFTGASQQAINLGNSMQQAIEKAKGTTGINLGFGEKQQLDNAQALIIAKNKLSSVNKSLNSEERFLAETELQLIQMEQDKALALANTREQLEKNIAATKEQIAASNQEVSNKMMSGLDSRWASAERGQATASLRGDTEAVAEYSARLEGLNNIYWQVDEAVTKTSQNITTAFINSLQQSNDQLTQGSQLFAPYIDGLRQLESVWQLSNQSHGHPVTLAREQVEAYIATLPQAVRQTESVTQAINNVRQAASGKALKAGVEELAKALEQVSFDAEKIETIMKQVGQGSKIKSLKADMKDLDKTIKELTASEERLKQAFANFNPTHNFTKIERITAMGSALSSTAMAAMSLKTIFTSWSNEDMSFGEKLTSSLMAIGMLIPSVSGAFKGLLTVMGLTNIQSLATAAILSAEATTRDILNGKITAETLAKQTGMALDQAEVLIRTTKLIALRGETKARTEEGAAIMASVVAKKLGMSVEQQEQLSKLLSTGLTLKQALAEMGLTGVKLKGIPATIAATLVNWGFNASLAAVLAIVAVLAISLVGLVGVIWLVTTAVNAITDAYNADAIAAERANEALKEQKEVLEEVKGKHEELINTLKEYDEAYNSLKQMTEGTDEWKEAVEQLNAQVVDLITNFPQLAKYVERENGVLTLNKKGIEEVKKASEKNLKDAEVRVSQTQRRANIANAQDKITNVAKKGYDAGDWWTTVGNRTSQYAATGLAVDGMTGGATGGLGTITMAVSGLIAGMGEAIYNDLNSAEIFSDAINSLVSQYEIGGEEFLSLDSTQNSLDNLASFLDMEKEELIELIRSTNALNETNRLLLEEEVKGLFDDDENFQKSKYQDVITEMATDRAEEAGQVTEQDKEEARSKLFDSYGDDYSSYLEAMYGEEAKNYRVIDTDGYNATVQKKNDKGEWETVGEKEGLTQDDAVEVVAQAQADKRGKENAKTINTKELDSALKQIEEDYKNLGFSNDTAIAMTKAIATDKEFNLADFKESELEMIRQKGASAAQRMADVEQYGPNSVTGLTSDDAAMSGLYDKVQQFDAEGGVLGAKNTDFKTMFQEVQQYNEEYNKMLQLRQEAEQNQAGPMILETLDQQIADMQSKSMEQKQQIVADAQALYAELSEEDKKIFAETVDFKIAKNKEMMQQMLKDEKERRAEATLDDAAEKYELDPDVLKTQAKLLQKTHKGLEDNAEAAAEMAVANQRMNKGVDKLTDNWKDWKKTLKGTDKTTQDYAEALVGAQDAMRDILNLSEDAVIPEDFLQAPENLDLLDQIANGSEEAVQKLHFNLTKAQIEAETFSSDIAQNMVNAFDFGDDVDLEATFNEMKTQALNALTEIQGMANGVDIGAGLKDPAKQAQMAAKLNEYAMAAGWTAEQMQSALASVGVRAKITMVEGNPVTKKIPITKITRSLPKITATSEHGIALEQLETSEVVGYKDVTEPTLVPQIDMEDPENPSGQIAPIFEKVDMGNIAPSATTGGKSSGDGGGGNGKSKVVQKKAPIKAKKEEDEIERYHEISKAIEDQERVVDRLSKAKDKAYGANKLKAIDKEIAALQKLNELDSQHLKQIREKLALDKKAASDKGITFDINGRINNYDEIIQKKMDSWLKEQEDIQKREIEYEESKNADENYDADGAIKLQIEQDKEKSDENYEEFKEAIEQYEETFSLFEDTVDKMQDQFDQMAEKTIEKIAYGVEFKVEFEEAAIDLLDFQINLLSKDFEGFSEIAMLTMTKVSHLNEILQAEGNEGIGALYEAYYQGTISLDQFAQTVQDSIPEILSTMEELMSVDEEMMEYYSQTFDAAEEKFTEYLDFIDGGTAKLDHLRNMLSLIGKEQNYDMLGVVLESQYTSASHKLQASSDWYEITKKEYDALYNRWITEKNLLGPKELEMLEDKLKVARTKMQEADEQRLSDLETVGEKAQEILQNNLDKARKKLEEALVGSSLEDYMTELDRLSKKQEEYLTATNKMYETNKLIRQAQMEMNKTDNNRAKQQYNDYVKYIEQLQESGKLSSYELSVAQAKYELLQAQIALEEAKDAKDQVRLTRDSEGNYGYVYTANEDKVSEAEQAVADAENKLYNIGLEGAQDYQSKKAEILQEAIDTFASIEEQYQTGQIETEAEFNAKMEEAKQYYYDRLKEYDNLYYMALGVMQEESYGNTVDYELDSRNIFDTFANTVDNYLGDVEQSFTDYDSKVEVVKQEVGDDLGAISQKTEEVTKKTEELAIEAEKLTGQIENELLSVREATSAWGSYRDELYKNIEANKTLIDQLKTIQQLAGGELEDYSSFISEQVANGKGYDDQLVQTALAKRWLKMKGKDDYDYAQMKNDYVQEYADANELSFEEAETALKDDAWYKTLGMLRQYKIERTDWAAIKKEILDKDPKADVSWVDSVIAEKLNYDWSAKIKKYIEDNPGLKYSDEYLQEMLAIRKVKIDSMKDEDKKDILSNDDLLAPYIEKGKLIDDRKSVSSAVSAATGGYTGEWGPEGKIAILHEKELILNAQDTQNFLSAVEILREINGMLDQNALVASLGAINMQALSLNSLADQVLQQEVTIHADFPNVTDHNEIELAIDNLINAASQHAYRT